MMRGATASRMAVLYLAVLAVAAGAQCSGSQVGGTCVAARDHQLMQVRKTWSTLSRSPSLLGAGNVISGGDTLFLTATNDKRVTVNGTSVFARWDHYGTWQKLRVEKIEGEGAIHSGEFIRLVAHTDLALVVKGSTVVAAASEEPHDDHLQIVRRDGAGEVKADDAVYLRARTMNIPIGLNADKELVALAAGGDIEGELFTVEAAAKEPTTTTATTTMEEGSHWEIEDVGECDVELGCHRDRTVVCKNADGTRLQSSECDRATRPSSYEACITLGQGSCLDIAESDCLDVPGCWWNRWRKTCPELAQEGACSTEAEPTNLANWEEGDVQLVRRACGAACGVCSERPNSAPKYVESPSCEEGVCEDDVVYRTPFGSGCFRWAGRDCNSVFFASDLKAACPKACRVCGSHAEDLWKGQAGPLQHTKEAASAEVHFYTKQAQAAREQ
mmetsp:Transcript_82850/g.213490  ORF Transcript_82850/g.213490 Transcript_82850/m.213490 type:complete len:444 (-) Transcript_82850:228-1559(-)